MAQIKQRVSASPEQHTAAEVKEWYNTHKNDIERFSKSQDPLTLRDITKSSTKTISTFDKESLRTYLKNIGSNEKNLRKLSWYLYYRCHAYFRLVMYNATAFCLNARSVIPQYSFSKTIDDKRILKTYESTVDTLETMNLQSEMLKAYIYCFIQDVFYGCVYYDDTGMFILPLDADYCKIAGMYYTGDFSFAYDMSYFRSRQTELEFLGEPFTTMYNAYLKDTSNGKWQVMPPEYAICMKARFEDWQTVVPVFSGMLNEIINLCDLADIQAIADKQDIYKMIQIELETITGSKDMNDWKIDPDTVIEYFDRMINEALPEYVSAAVIPGKIETVGFSETDRVNDTNKISKATKALFNSSGGAQILNSEDITGTELVKASSISDMEFAHSSLLPQTQNWVNRYLGTQLTNPCKVKFMDVSPYTLQSFKESIRSDAEYGLPVKILLNNLNGFNEKDTAALNYLEENILKLSEKFKPLLSSHTTSQANTSTTSDASDTSDTTTAEKTGDTENGK